MKVAKHVAEVVMTTAFGVGLGISVSLTCGINYVVDRYVKSSLAQVALINEHLTVDVAIFIAMYRCAHSSVRFLRSRGDFQKIALPVAVCSNIVCCKHSRGTKPLPKLSDPKPRFVRKRARRIVAHPICSAVQRHHHGRSWEHQAGKDEVNQASPLISENCEPSPKVVAVDHPVIKRSVATGSDGFHNIF